MMFYTELQVEIADLRQRNMMLESELAMLRGYIELAKDALNGLMTSPEQAQRSAQGGQYGVYGSIFNLKGMNRTIW